MRRFSWVCVAALALLAGCDSWFGENQAPPLPGTRVSILAQSRSIEPDRGPPVKIVLPEPEQVRDWPEAGGYSPHAMYHLALRDSIKEAWSADIGNGGSKRRAFLSQPVVEAGRVYALDSEATVTALDLKTGRRFWHVDLTPDDVGSGTFGGGLALDGGRLFVTTNYAQLVALNPQNGKRLWTIDLPAPVRGAPTARGGRVLVITVENETIAFSGADGHRLWHHTGMDESAALMGAPSPAIDGNTVVVPYTSGELYALRIENGTPLWSDVVSGLHRTDQITTMASIRGLPVIDRNRVFVASNSDMLAAIDIRSGRRLWDRAIGSWQTPWIAGNFIYLLTNGPDVTCIEADTGRVVWVTALQQWGDMEELRNPLVWVGPVLASDRLLLASSAGDLLSVSPYTGKVMGRMELDDGVTIPPLVADGTLLIVTQAGELLAFR